jgi:hypothetical protein
MSAATQAPAFAWYHRPKEHDHTISLCAGHAYLAPKNHFVPGPGNLRNLGDAVHCCVCLGTATIDAMMDMPLAPVSPAEAEENQKLVSIEAALTAYHCMLDRKGNTNTAIVKFVDEIERILGRPWVQGATLERKEPS